jgi:hypothetical protein
MLMTSAPAYCPIDAGAMSVSSPGTVATEHLDRHDVREWRDAGDTAVVVAIMR